MIRDDRHYVDGILAFMILSGLICYGSFSVVWHDWDHNGDGIFTIRDVFQLIGEGLSIPYVWTYGEAQGVMTFLEVPVPYAATTLTAMAGLTCGLTAALAGAFLVGGLSGWVRRFPPHWRGEA